MLTGSNGSFTEQIVTYGFYNQTGGNTPYLKTPHNLTITHSSYDTLNYLVTINEWKTVVQVVLISAQEDYSIVFLAIGLSVGLCLMVVGVKIKKMSVIEELLFTSGSWLGFLMITLFSFALLKLEKYTSLITSVIFVLLGIEYFTRYNSGTEDFLWFWVLSWVMPVLLILAMFKMRD